MSARALVHNNTFIFDDTNYDTWQIHMLNYFWVMDPTMEQIIDMSFSPPKDSHKLSLEDEKKPIQGRKKMVPWHLRQTGVVLPASRGRIFVQKFGRKKPI
jgi:hypothetical protein